MNKQLQRDLQAHIQQLKASQLTNVLQHYEILASTTTHKNINKKGMHYECQLVCGCMAVKGFGRNQEQAFGNACKNLLSGLVGKNIDVQKITQSLKYKNGLQTTQSKSNIVKNKQQTIFLDDISMIQPNQNIQFQLQTNKKPQKQKQKVCDCIYFQMQKYQSNQIKHLQARINLLSEQNSLLKKMLMHGQSSKYSFSELSQKKQIRQKNKNKQNDSYCGNNIVTEGNSTSKMRILPYQAQILQYN